MDSKKEHKVKKSEPLCKGNASSIKIVCHASVEGMQVKNLCQRPCFLTSY